MATLRRQKTFNAATSWILKLLPFGRAPRSQLAQQSRTSPNVVRTEGWLERAVISTYREVLSQLPRIALVLLLLEYLKTCAFGNKELPGRYQP